MNNIDGAIDFCSSFDAGLKDEIAGATQKQIDELETFSIGRYARRTASTWNAWAGNTDG
jgi:hypothetical protein